MGERERVPALRHDFQSNEWNAIARLMAKGLRDLQYFPTMIYEAFLVSVLFGEEAVSEEIPLNSFYKYLAKDEEDIVKEFLKEEIVFQDMENELIDFLNRFRKIPTKENVKSLLLEIAHRE
eukprot:gene1692-biopygen1550